MTSPAWRSCPSRKLDVDGAVFDWDSARVIVRHDGQTREVAALQDLWSEAHPHELVGYPDSTGGVVYQPSGGDASGIWHLAAGVETPELLVPPPNDPSAHVRLAGVADLNGIPYVLYVTGRASSISEDEGEQLVRSALDGSHTEVWLEDVGYAWEGGAWAARIAGGWTSIWRLDSVLNQIWRFTPGVDFGTEPAFGSDPIFESDDGDPVDLVDFDMVSAREAGLLTVILTTSGPDERYAHPATLRVDVGIGAETSSQHIEVPSDSADVTAFAVSTNGSHIVVSRRNPDGALQPLIYDLKAETWSRLDVTGMVRLVPPPTTVAS